MALHRNRWVQMLVGLALGLQLLIASGLAVSAPCAHCGAAHAQTMDGDECQACGAHDHGARTQSSGLCKVACAVASVAAPLPLNVFVMPASRDAVPAAVANLRAQFSPDDLLRPPADAAFVAA